jgi:amino acid transporter
METGKPKRTLSVIDAIAVVVGIVIGAGIFVLPPAVAGNVPSSTAYMAVWLAGGFISLIGALCYAELATTYPDAGGEYHFLHRGLGPGTAFLFAWARMTVIQTGSIAIHAFFIGKYVADLFVQRGWADNAAVVSAIVAIFTVVGLTAINIAGLRTGKSAQRVFTGCVVAAMLLVCVGGLIPSTNAAVAAVPTSAPTTAATSAASFSSLGLAMVFVLLVYGGWNEAAYLSAEVRGERRGIVKVLLGGIALVTAIYLFVNFVYLNALGLSGISKSQALAADVLRGRVGEWAATAVSVAVVIAAAGNMNATILTGARTSYALGRDFRMFAPLGRWRDGVEAPVTALLFQGVITLGLVVFGAFQFNSLQSMVEYTTPVFWFFFLLTGVSLIVLRVNDRKAQRPFRVPLFPITPALFCLVCGYMLYSGLNHFGLGAFVGVVVLALGMPLMVAARAQLNRDRGGKGSRGTGGFEPVVPGAGADAAN